MPSAAETYDAAADVYDTNAFWDRFGRRTIERLGLTRDDRVLDVCCGSGASALAAAEVAGSVLAVDLAENLLALGRRKAAARGLQNIEFRRADLLDLPAGDFDAVVCVFGVFFVPDVAAAVRSLRSRVRRGGRLAITTWGPRFYEPATSVFWNAVRDVRPDLYRGFNPWDRICDPESLRAVLAEGDVSDAEIVAEAGTHPIASADDWWNVVMGSGFRGTIERSATPTARRSAR